MKKTITPIFVIGSPRSGTTMLGALIGSDDNILWLNELSSFYFSHWVARKEYARAPSKYKESYLKSLQEHSRSFAEDLCKKEGKRFFVEDTPWNFRIIKNLNKLYPNAHYVLSYRTCTKVMESMRKSFQLGYKWAGPKDNDRISLWNEAYSCIHALPKERTIFYSYDFFTANPEKALNQLKSNLDTQGLPTQFDASVLTTRHASAETKKDLPVQMNKGKVTYKKSAPTNEKDAIIDPNPHLPKETLSLQKEVLLFKKSLTTLVL